MDIMNTFTEMYVCSNYIQDERKLRIQVGRPNYNSRDLESATIILAASIPINEREDEGPPRYYAVGSGTNDVDVEEIYMTTLDRVSCAKGYTIVESANEGSISIYQARARNPCVALFKLTNHDTNSSITLHIRVF